MRRGGFSVVSPSKEPLSWPSKVIIAAGCATAAFALGASMVATVLVLIWLGKEVL